MKIGLITTHYAINYGAALQAYALYKELEKFGRSEIVNIVINTAVSGRKINYKIDSIHNILLSCFTLFNFKYRKQFYEKIRLFDRFIKTKCKLSSEIYTSYDDVRQRLPFYDYLVCGSDQIWNLNLLQNPIFFLRFEDIYPNTKYIAYAPSVAEKLTKEQYNILAENIKHFSAISVREKEGVDEVQKCTNKIVKNVLDPVFLLEAKDWELIMEPVEDIKVPYILLYTIAGNKEYTRVVNIIRKIYPYLVVCISTHAYNKFNADMCIYDTSPENFLWLIRNAEFVCTSSFHATAFSIIFEKQFIAIPDKRRSSRHESLLQQLGIENRLVFHSKDIKSIDHLGIDFISVRENLVRLRQESINFLKESLC
ncbi:MAG: polysaccharide pyruvyl transferase family protein [Candidatus Azobacteroides sp.]|nr:polysaccharide pyruvyl transferase family protein [Candidatus Azobacteroides sp.]